MNPMEIAQRCRDAMWSNDLACRDLGMAIEVTEPGSAKAQFQVREHMVNGYDICHGGFIFTLADSAFAYACNSYNRATVAASASIEFVRPAKLGDELVASAKEVHRGGRTGVYDIVVTNRAKEVIAIFRGRSYVTRDTVFKSDTN